MAAKVRKKLMQYREEIKNIGNYKRIKLIKEIQLNRISKKNSIQVS